MSDVYGALVAIDDAVAVLLADGMEPEDIVERVENAIEDAQGDVA